MDLYLSSLSTRGDTNYTPMPRISKDISDTKCENRERARNILLQAIYHKQALLRVKLRHQMQRKIVRLWNACTEHQDLQVQQKNNLELWKHIQDCCDKDCKEKFCQSRRHITMTYSKCCKTLNQHSIGNFCVPAMDHIVRESRDDCRLREKHSEIRIGKTKETDETLIYDFGENKTSTSYRSKRISGVSQSSYTSAACVKRNTFPGESVVQDITTKRPLFPQQLHPVEHTQACKEEQITNVVSPNPNISLEKLHAEISLSDPIAFDRKRLLEEERKDRSDVLIALLSLKKRTYNQTIPDAAHSSNASFAYNAGGSSKKIRVER